MNVRDIIRDFYQECDSHELSSRIILARGLKNCKKLAGVKDVKLRYWKTEMPYLLIDAVFAYDAGDMDYAFRKVRLILSRLLADDVPEEMRKFIHDIEHDTEWNARIFKFLKQVPPLSLSFKEWSEQTCKLLKDFWELSEKPIFVPFKKKEGYKMSEMEKMAEVPVEQYHQSNDKGSDFHKSIDTIHAVKGATFDAVLLFLSADSRGESISIKDFPQNANLTMTESQRMIYVACSRATQFLALAIPKSIADEDIRRTLAGIDIDIR